ncbi:unnamed protein product, partial [Trichogramma brassicae]
GSDAKYEAYAVDTGAELPDRLAQTSQRTDTYRTGVYTVALALSKNHERVAQSRLRRMDHGWALQAAATAAAAPTRKHIQPLYIPSDGKRKTERIRKSLCSLCIKSNSRRNSFGDEPTQSYTRAARDATYIRSRYCTVADAATAIIRASAPMRCMYSMEQLHNPMAARSNPQATMDPAAGMQSWPGAAAAQQANAYPQMQRHYNHMMQPQSAPGGYQQHMPLPRPHSG